LFLKIFSTNLAQNGGVNPSVETVWMSTIFVMRRLTSLFDALHAYNILTLR
jgi:hypothetical protein